MGGGVGSRVVRTGFTPLRLVRRRVWSVTADAKIPIMLIEKSSTHRW